MKFSLLLLLPAALTVGAQLIEVRATACAAGNNCQRGVGGTAGAKPPLASRLADCSSLNTVTVTPATFTSTETISVFTDVRITPKAKRTIDSPVTVTPTVVPTYATYCSNPSAYYSACSCAGVTAVTTEAPTPTVVTTVTSTITCFAERNIKRGLHMVGGIMNYGKM